MYKNGSGIARILVGGATGLTLWGSGISQLMNRGVDAVPVSALLLLLSCVAFFWAFGD